MTVSIILGSGEESARHCHSSPWVGLLKRALAKKPELHGEYAICALHAGHSNRPDDVRTLIPTAACREGVALWFPNGEPHGVGCLLKPQKIHGKLLVEPIKLFNELPELLAEEEDSAESTTTTPATRDKAATSRGQNALQRLRADRASYDAFIALLCERTTITTRDFCNLVRSTLHEFKFGNRSLGMLRSYLTTLGILTLAKNAPHPSSRVWRVRAGSAADRVSDRKVELPKPTNATPVNIDPQTPSPLREIARLQKRRDELRPFYEEYLAIEAELEGIRKLLT